MPAVWIKGPEALEQSIANTFTLYLNAELDNVWSAWSFYDGANVPPKVYPAMIYAGGRVVIPEYPALVVQSLEGTEVNDGAPLFGEQQHILEATVVCASDDYHVLDVQTKRYLVAMWEVIKKHQALDATTSGLAGVATLSYGRSGVYTKSNDATLLYRAAAWRIKAFSLESV